MNLAATLASFLSLATLAQSAKSDAVSEDNPSLRHLRRGGRVRGNYGNSTNVVAPRNTKRTFRTGWGNQGTKLDPCQKVVDFWTSTRIKSACTKSLHLSFDDGGDRSRNLQGRNLQSSVVDDPWEQGGDVLQAAGRLLFRMGGGLSSCSATAVTDGSKRNGRSIIITAAHCVFNSRTKKFADYFMFIPNQDDGGSDTSDLNCNNDRFGCWTPSFAVVDDDWASGSWSSNMPADYAFLVVDDVGNHRGPSGVSDVLDEAVPAMDVSFQRPNYGRPAYGMGYSGNRDPDFRYCVQDLDNYPSRGGYILNGCGLTGGSSGGPWFQTLNRRGRGDVIAVNSYGPAGGRGYMGGPRLHDNSAQCLFELAKSIPENAASGNGVVVTYNGNDPAPAPSPSGECAGSDPASCGCDEGKQADYRGDAAVTVSGKTCQAWEAQAPHRHSRTPGNYPGAGLAGHNHCRNPDGNDKAWCYTTDPGRRWELCAVPPCAAAAPSGECPGSNPATCGCDEGKQADYRGGIAVTASGYACQAWDAQAPHAHSRTPGNYPDAGLAGHNHCRNPDGNDRAWCYTTDPDQRWDFCAVPSCAAAASCSSATYVSGTEFNNPGGGSCAPCSRYQDAYDQACCDEYGGNEYYARYVSPQGTITCGRCSLI